MNTNDGIIHESHAAALRAGVPHTHIMRINPTARQRERGKVGRNDPCPCGSGKKFKKCHLGKPAL